MSNNFNILTLGCKVNQYESESMKELFEKAGYTYVNPNEEADVYIINTCTVTSMSDKKSRQFIRRAKRNNPESLIAVVGCYSQIAPDEVLEIEGVNLVLGTDDRSKIVEIIEDIKSGSKEKHVKDIMSVREFEEMSIDTVDGRTRAYLKVQEGCNQFCSYCIIPFARGPVRSRQKENVVDEVKRLAEHGFKEIVLTGIHVASYGKDLEDYKLIDLLEDISKVDGIERVRLSSVAPQLLTEDFIDRISKIDKFCNHFHLSLQSGCDATLKRMNRRYTTAEYRKSVEDLRNHFDNPSITTDIIVGFPGETDEEFNTTKDFVKEIGFGQVHVFKYSIRKGTKAAIMENQVQDQIKSSRSEELIKLTTQLQQDYLKGYLGKEVEVLFETFDDQEKTAEGLTTNYMRVRVSSEKDLSNVKKIVEIKDIESETLLGSLV